MKVPAFLAVALVLLAAGRAQALRDSSEISTGWKFIARDVAPDASTAGWEPVTVPHTWNAKAGQEGEPLPPGDPTKVGYRRMACWYEHDLDIPAAWKGRRVFIRFEAASILARTYLNGELLGEHRGAFTAFCYELTSHLHYGARNELRVRVDNSFIPDIPPISGDFDMMGGIYRPVHLFTTDAVCISPLDYASCGVYVSEKKIGAEEATLDVKTLVSNGATTPQTVDVVTDLRDAAGAVAASARTPVTLAAGETRAVMQPLGVTRPHLWNGRNDPYLYTSRVRLDRAGSTVDEITQPIGLRTFAITEAQGFLLNGRPYPIHGVCRHQDRWPRGWAITPADHDEDERDILELGATAVRLAHYPQSEYFYGLCDRDGLLLWNEVSLIWEIRNNPQFLGNARQQLREMIAQRYNHPSVAFWGLFNELQKTEAYVPLVTPLRDLVHQLDPTRLVVGASFIANSPTNQVPDHIAFNRYPGWYNGEPGDLTQWIIDRYHENHDRRVALSEYGAGGNPAQHEEGPLKKPVPESQFHPEEWQTYVHECDWAQIQGNPHLWGSFIWVMFDFASIQKQQGGHPGINDKGLVTEDRKIKKDAFYFYKANWNPAPMVYIASRRMTPRKLPVTDVQVFSNLEKVSLIVNGHALRPVTGNPVHVFQWNAVRLQPGVNHVVARAISHGIPVTDSCDWVLESR